MTVLQMHDIHRSFEPGVPVLAGVDVTVGQGEVVGLLGRNGAVHAVFRLDPDVARELIADRNLVAFGCNFLVRSLSIIRRYLQTDRAAGP